MIGMNTGNASAAETPFGGIKESGYGKESGKDVAINEYMVSWQSHSHLGCVGTNTNRTYRSPRLVRSPWRITIRLCQHLELARMICSNVVNAIV